MNYFKEMLKKDGPSIGLFITMPEPTIVEAAKYAGYDYIRIDMEHAAMTHAQVSELIRTANLLNLAVQVRVSPLDARDRKSTRLNSSHT